MNALDAAEEGDYAGNSNEKRSGRVVMITQHKPSFLPGGLGAEARVTPDFSRARTNCCRLSRRLSRAQRN